MLYLLFLFYILDLVNCFSNNINYHHNIVDYNTINKLNLPYALLQNIKYLF